MDVPTFPGALLGYRSWYVGLVDDGSGPSPCLQPIACRDRHGRLRWKPGLQMAECLRRDHVAPQQNCTCGLYAVYDLKKIPWIWANRSYITGAVVAAGEIHYHRRGFRSEQMQIIALLNDKRIPFCEQLAADYGVPLFDDKDELEQFAEKKGIPFATTGMELPKRTLLPAKATVGVFIVSLVFAILWLLLTSWVLSNLV